MHNLNPIMKKQQKTKTGGQSIKRRKGKGKRKKRTEQNRTELACVLQKYQGQEEKC